MSTKPLKFGLAALMTAAVIAGPVAAQQAAPAGQPAAGQPAAGQPAPAAGAPAGQPAAGQPQNPNGPVKIQMQTFDKTNWVKVCPKTQQGGKDFCMTTRDFTTAQDQPPPVALAIYDVKGDDSRLMRILLPVGMMLRPGVRLSVDKGPTLEGNYDVCMPNGCFVEMKVNGKTLADMKKGTNLNIMTKGMGGNEITFALPLANFGKDFDGPAIPQEVLIKQQQDQQAALQKQLQEQAEARRQQIEKAAGSAPAAGAPAAGAPAAPAAPKP